MLTKEYLKDTLGDWVKLIPYSVLHKVITTLNKEFTKSVIYPAKEDIFKAFKLTQFRDLKVVILGQDPYHDGSANGLAFSNNIQIGRISPSLRTIFREIEVSIYDGLKLDQDPNLERWAKQGILLLNTSLTVRKGEAESHLMLWSEFTKTLLTSMSEYNTGIIYLLWGKKAQYYKQYINTKTNYILEAGHPSPLNRSNPFIGCGHFKEVNNILKKQDRECINW